MRRLNREILSGRETPLRVRLTMSASGEMCKSNELVHRSAVTLARARAGRRDRGREVRTLKVSGGLRAAECAGETYPWNGSLASRAQEIARPVWVARADTPGAVGLGRVGCCSIPPGNRRWQTPGARCETRSACCPAPMAQWHPRDPLSVGRGNIPTVQRAQTSAQAATPPRLISVLMSVPTARFQPRSTYPLPLT